jgi:hypothetical protein
MSLGAAEASASSDESPLVFTVTTTLTTNIIYIPSFLLEILCPWPWNVKLSSLIHHSDSQARLSS